MRSHALGHQEGEDVEQYNNGNFINDTYNATRIDFDLHKVKKGGVRGRRKKYEYKKPALQEDNLEAQIC